MAKEANKARTGQGAGRASQARPQGGSTPTLAGTARGGASLPLGPNTSKGLPQSQHPKGTQAMGPGRSVIKGTASGSNVRNVQDDAPGGSSLKA